MIELNSPAVNFSGRRRGALDSRRASRLHTNGMAKAKIAMKTAATSSRFGPPSRSAKNPVIAAPNTPPSDPPAMASGYQRLASRVLKNS